MYENDPWLRRRFGAGLLLALFLALALALPLWLLRGNDHPLAGAASLDLCAQLTDLTQALGLEPRSVASTGAAGSCQWLDSEKQVRFEAMLATTRTSSPQSIVAVFSTWRNEVKASGAQEFSEEGEEGERRLSYRRDRNREQLIEDHGIMLWLRGLDVDATEFARFGDTAQSQLRLAKKPASP